MKKIFLFLTMIFIILSCVSCGTDRNNFELEILDMKEICELSVMKCYYHNVAKYNKEDTQGFLWWKKDTHFWIEYTGVVTLGIDAEKVDIRVNGEKVTIILPLAKVLDWDLDEQSMVYYVDGDSSKVHVEDEQAAIVEAQAHMKQEVETNRELLNDARERAKILLENYIISIGKHLNITYEIEWEYLDET